MAAGMEQENATLPLDPGEGTALRLVVADPPGDEMLRKVDCSCRSKSLPVPAGKTDSSTAGLWAWA